MQYYDEVQLVPIINTHNVITGEVEKWEAHKKSILHRAVTCILIVGTQVVLQERKHPAFNRLLDCSFSTHPIKKKGGSFETNEEAIYSGLKREWIINKSSTVSPPHYISSLYYKAKDSESIFFEHEIDEFYIMHLSDYPQANLNFAYGLKYLPFSKLSHLSPDEPIYHSLAPWVQAYIQKGSLKEYTFLHKSNERKVN